MGALSLTAGFVAFFVSVAKMLTQSSMDPGAEPRITEIKSTYVRSLYWHIVLLGLVRRPLSRLMLR